MKKIKRALISISDKKKLKPLLATLKKFNIDPALAGGVVLTTITDVIGYMTFLGLGAIFLL